MGGMMMKNARAEYLDSERAAGQAYAAYMAALAARSTDVATVQATYAAASARCSALWTSLPLAVRRAMRQAR